VSSQVPPQRVEGSQGAAPVDAPAAASVQALGKGPATPGAKGKPVYRGRALAGLVLGLGLGLVLAHGLLSRSLATESLEREQRQVGVSLLALTDLVQRAGGSGEAVRAAVATWQAALPAGSRLRVVSGTSLEASTFPEDSGERAAPRRLSRDEKPLYDRAQELRASVETNREEGGARKAEVDARPQEDGSLLLAAPVEVEGRVVGMVELATPMLTPPPPLSPLAALAFLFIPALVWLGLSWGLRQQRLLVATTLVALVVGLGGHGLYAAGQYEQALRATPEAVAAQLRDMTSRVGSVLTAQGLTAEPPLAPAAWDADRFRKPFNVVSSAGQVVAQAVEENVARRTEGMPLTLLALLALSSVLLLYVGTGGLHRTVATAIEHRQAYFYILPAMVGVVVLVFFPFAYGITLSFTDSTLYNTNQPLWDIWVGVRNYGEILSDFSVGRRAEDGAFVLNYENFYYTLGFTVFWTVTNVVLSVTLGLVLALVLNVPNLALRPVYRVLLILPWAVPNYITALIWKGMFHQQFGVVNHVIRMFGGQGISWFDSPFTSFLTALTTNVWLGFPFMMVVSLGALQSIPTELYEAARVDGASRWQQFTAITLPSLRPALVPAIILSVVWTFNMFNIIYLVTDGEPGRATEILVTQAYKFAFQRYRYGYAAAYSTIIFGILLLYSVVQNRLSRATEAY
jgi:arabinogalactan oligomer / maltooligosaccharide transport system permease protein